METLTKTRRIGGSFIVTLPKTMVETENLTDNQIVTIEVRKVKKSGFGMFKT